MPSLQAQNLDGKIREERCRYLVAELVCRVSQFLKNVLKFRKLYNFKIQKNLEEKFQKFKILKIPKNFQFEIFLKFPIWKI